ALHRVLRRCAAEGLVHSMSDVSDGGLAVCLAKASFSKNIGAELFSAVSSTSIKTLFDLFGESSSTVVLTCKLEDFAEIEKITEEETGSVFAEHIGTTMGDRLTIPFENAMVDASLAELKGVWAGSLEAQLAEEVVA
ncbi:MAG TPA: AIR synthase-related protein, partial [Edaphobacter sp.]|nr:AIR synthase-related protein [Edaphobacter sp.]